MRRIPLTQGKVALVDDEDYEYLNQWKWWYLRVGYAATRINNEYTYMHRFLISTPKNFYTDHKNMNKLDNRKSNLRIVNNSLNNFHKGAQSNNTSGIPGVAWDKANNKWIAQIMINRKNKKIGRYILKEDAIKARKESELKYFGEFAGGSIL